MALAACEQCDRPISTDARRCPACGAVTAAGRRWQQRLIVLAVVVAVLAIIAYSVYQSEVDSRRSARDFHDCVQTGQHC